MHILKIEKYDNYSDINFVGKNPTKKILPALAVMAPITLVTNSITNTDLYNKSVDDDKRIEEYLLSAIQSQERISKQKIADDLSIKIKTCERKIRRGTPLYELWLQTNHAGIVSEEIDENVIENKKRLEYINSELWRIVNEAYENKTPITYSQLSRELGITPQNCISRIKNNKELFDKWKQIEHPRITEESENINQQIENILTEAKNKGRTVSYKVIAEKIGITKDAVEQRIHTYPQLKSLIAQSRYGTISEKSFIENINKQQDKKGTFRIIGFDAIIEQLSI